MTRKAADVEHRPWIPLAADLSLVSRAYQLILTCRQPQLKDSWSQQAEDDPGSRPSIEPSYGETRFDPDIDIVATRSAKMMYEHRSIMSQPTLADHRPVLACLERRDLERVCNQPSESINNGSERRNG